MRPWRTVFQGNGRRLVTRASQGQTNSARHRTLHTGIHLSSMRLEDAEGTRTTMIVDTPTKLERASTAWAASKIVGIDTEFISKRTFFPIPCLYQIGDSNQNSYLLDPLTLKNMQPFADLLQEPGTVKVMHSCWGDLTVFQHGLDVIPCNVFDTQLAAAFCNYKHNISYSELVSQCLKLQLPKTETMSDWQRRPLTAGQLDYAREDVLYLPQLHAILHDKLRSTQRFSWYEEELLQLQADFSQDIGDYYKKYQKVHVLTGVELHRFRKLCIWREKKARQTNLPRKWVFTDEQLFDYAVQKTSSPKNIAGIGDRREKKYGIALQEIWETAACDQRENWPQQMPRPVPQGNGWLYSESRKFAERKAREHQISASLLFTRRKFNDLLISLRDHAKPDVVFQGWRSEVLGNRFFDWIIQLVK